MWGKERNRYRECVRDSESDFVWEGKIVCERERLCVCEGEIVCE